MALRPHPPVRRRAVRALLVVALAAGAGCGGPPPAPGATAPPPPEEAPRLLLINCSGCHDGSGSDAGRLRLSSPTLVGALVGKPASGSACAGSGRVLVDPATGGGLLLDKLRQPPCGDRMPQGTTPLSGAEIAVIQQWLRQSFAGADP